MTDRYLEVDGARLRYRDEGSGPAVLFIHGWTLDLDLWEPQAAELATVLRIVRWDRRGFGLSSGHPSLASDVTDCGALCRHLAITRASLLGMSQGARVALRASRAAVIEIDSIVLDGPPPNELAIGTDAESDLPMKRLRSIARREGMAAFRAEWARHPFTQLETKDAAARALLERMLARYPGTDLLEPEGSVGGSEVACAAPTLPTLVLNGASDAPSRRRAGAAFARQFLSGQHVLVPEAGHLPNLDNPRVYNAALLAFLSRHTAQWPTRVVRS